MEANQSGSNRSSNNKQNRLVLGRSAVTGQYVLRPASKQGAASIRAINAAVKTVLAKQSK